MKTEMVFRNAKPKEKPYKVSDGGGLHMLIQPTGSKLWRIAYRFETQQRTHTVGNYPDVSLTQARQALLHIKTQIDTGIDPKGPVKGPRKGMPSFRQMAEEWFANWKDGRSPNYTKLVRSRLKRDIYPAIGDMALDAIEAPDVLAMLRTVEQRGNIEMARRLRQTCDQVYRYAFALGVVKQNPASNALVNAMKPKPKVKHMPRLPARELPHFLEQCRTQSGASELTWLAIRFTALTWARTIEIRKAQWSEFEGDLWRIPPERMKMRREHLIPLSRQAQETLQRLREISESKLWVFPNDRNPAKPASENMMLYVCYRLGYRGRMTIHGFRGSASTWANESGRYNSDWIEMALAHGEDDSARAAYNAALYLPQRTAMLQDWANFLEADEFDELM